MKWLRITAVIIHINTHIDICQEKCYTLTKKIKDMKILIADKEACHAKLFKELKICPTCGQEI